MKDKTKQDRVKVLVGPNHIKDRVETLRKQGIPVKYLTLSHWKSVLCEYVDKDGEGQKVYFGG